MLHSTIENGYTVTRSFAPTSNGFFISFISNVRDWCSAAAYAANPLQNIERFLAIMDVFMHSKSPSQQKSTSHFMSAKVTCTTKSYTKSKKYMIDVAVDSMKIHTGERVSHQFSFENSRRIMTIAKMQILIKYWTTKMFSWRWWSKNHTSDQDDGKKKPLTYLD